MAKPGKTPFDQMMKKLRTMEKDDLINLVMKLYITPDEREGEVLEQTGVETAPIMEALARQMGGEVSDLEVPVMTELNSRQIYALAGLLCSVGDENSPDYDPIKAFAYWFMTLQISHKRSSRMEVIEALKSVGQPFAMPMEQPGRIARFKRWSSGE